MADGYGQRPQGSAVLKNLATTVATGSEGVADLAIWYGFPKPTKEAIEPLPLPARLVAKVPHTGLAPLGLLNVGPPKPLLGARVSDADELGLPTHAFDKQDGDADLDLCSAPRLVTHIDDAAVTALTGHYA